MRPLAAALMIYLLAISAGCNSGSGKTAATQPARSTTINVGTGAAALERAARSALSENRRLSIYVLWNNRIPSWAQRSTRGAALASLRGAAKNRQSRGIRVRILKSRRQVITFRLDPSYTRAKAVVLDRQRVQPSRPNGHPIGRPVVLNERARYELRRVGESDRFIVSKVVLLR
jgi:hypothetical protein